MIAIHELLVRRIAVVRLLANGKTDVEQVKKMPSFFQAFAIQGRMEKVTKSGRVAKLSPNP